MQSISRIEGHLTIYRPICVLRNCLYMLDEYNGLPRGGFLTVSHSETPMLRGLRRKRPPPL